MVPEDQTPLQGHRTLAAIVFSDVVNYTGRVSRAEEYTLSLVRRDLEQMTRYCEQYEGKVLKFTGDGLLMYFSSAVQAVTCALEIQKTFAKRAAELSAEEVLQHRIGIHLGDVFVSPTDVMGDGVNIAARLQSEAEPGGICLSQIVYDVVKKRLELQATYLGPRELKHIQEAVPIYQIVLAAQSKTVSPISQVATPPAPENRLEPQSLTAPTLAIALLSEEQKKSLERLVAETLGPIAPVLVQQTWSQATTLQDVINRLANKIPQSTQASFRERANQIFAEAEVLPPHPPASTAVELVQPVAASIEPSLIQKYEYELTRAIGPIARMIVQRTVTQQPNLSPAQLIDTLAQHLPTPEATAAFRQKLQDLP